MAKKTNKTAHVLNLISPTRGEEPIQPEAKAVSHTLSEMPPLNETAINDLLSDDILLEQPKVRIMPARSPLFEDTAPKSKQESIGDVLHLSENTEELSDLIKDNLEKAFELAIAPKEEPTPMVRVTSKSYSAPAPAVQEPMVLQPKEASFFTVRPEPITSEVFAPDPFAEIAHPAADQTPELSLEDLLADKIAAYASDIEQPSEKASAKSGPQPEPVVQPYTPPVQPEPVVQPYTPPVQPEPVAQPYTPPVQPEPIVQPYTPPVQPEPEPVVQPYTPPVQPEPVVQPYAPTAQPEPQPVIPSVNPLEELEELELSTEPNYYQCMNVYEQIVKNLAPEYVERFNVCSCSRCLMDVIALTLTNLPAKYIIVDDAKTTPLIDFYTRKFQSHVMTELTKACFVVQEFPRH